MPSVEHKAILATAQQLRDLHGFEVTIVPVDRFGQVDPADVARAIRPNTALISIMAANNEIGTLQPVAEIGRIAREHGILFHSDAVQAIAMQPWDMTAQPVDLLSIAPHKFYGPKGVGVLYVRDGIDLVAPLTGGSQENDRRPGTENVAFAVGAARALELAQRELPQLVPHYDHWGCFDWAGFGQIARSMRLDRSPHATLAQSRQFRIARSKCQRSAHAPRHGWCGGR